MEPGQCEGGEARMEALGGAEVGGGGGGGVTNYQPLSPATR